MAGTAARSVLAVVLPLLLVGVASGQSTSLNQAQSCLEAARKELGPTAEVAKCGHLTRTAALETVAVIRLRRFPRTADGGMAVSKLVVLRKNKRQWEVELTVGNLVTRNRVGYVGMDYIDDSMRSAREYAGYRVWFSDIIDEERKTPGFAILLSNLRWDRDREAEGTSWEIAWNPSVGRFQYYAENEDPPGFRPEKKNLERLSEWLKRHGCGGVGKPPCDKK